MQRNVYLKPIDKNDINILNNYNNDFNKINKKGWVNEDRFVNLIEEWEKDNNDIDKVHLFPYWLFDNNDVIGLVIIKNNTDVDEMWREYGGNISYVILPSYRNMGYGTISLTLALDKCKELGLNSVLVTCLDDNIGSMKIIEKNNGVLKDIVKDKYKDDKLLRRYIINID